MTRTQIPLAATKRRRTYRLRPHRAGVIAATQYRRGNPIQELPPRAANPVAAMILIVGATIAMRRRHPGRHAA